jgi:hypothetical protein
MMNKNTHTMLLRRWLFQSSDAARLPPTSAGLPGILPTVAGAIWSCSVASACCEVASIPIRPAAP